MSDEDILVILVGRQRWCKPCRDGTDGLLTQRTDRWIDHRAGTDGLVTGQGQMDFDTGQGQMDW